ncbi:MAG: MBL fold metallo-hydrolase [Chloroflexi bacterium]|nr:MBL fold metallo-hydrolase [Chloroflexota bacterium]
MVDYRLSIGNAEVIAFSDATFQRGPTEFFRATSDKDWGPYRDLMTPEGQLRINIGCYAVRSQGRWVMVDTGIGPGPVAALGSVQGQLGRLLKERGVPAEEVAAVVFTHLHVDHVGWNITPQEGKPRPLFPNARYLASRSDWEFFTSPENQQRFPYIKTQVLPLQQLGILELTSGEKRVTDEVRTVPTPGHTPGHVSVAIASGGQRGFILGDVAHHPAQAAETDWGTRADVDPDLARHTRHQVFDQLEREGTTVAAGHFPTPGFGRLVRAQGRRYWQVL